jgi:acyl transferase domain-containing protein
MTQQTDVKDYNRLVAIVGIGFRLAGGRSNLGNFWRPLIDGRPRIPVC